jgi:hypothetical protein
MPLLTI